MRLLRGPPIAEAAGWGPAGWVTEIQSSPLKTWWVEAGLHLREFCQQNGASLVDIARTGFEHDAALLVKCDEALFHLVAYVGSRYVVPQVCKQICEEFYYIFAQARFKNMKNLFESFKRPFPPREDLLQSISEPIKVTVFDHQRFAYARDFGCGRIVAGATWCEVLMMLLCLMRGKTYCPVLCGCDSCGSSEDGDDNFM